MVEKKKTSRYSAEFRERAVHLLEEHRSDYPSLSAACREIGGKLGCSGGSVFVSLYGVLGWRIGCFVMALIVLSLTAPMLFYNQENREVFPVSPQELRPGLLNAIRRGEIWCGIVLTIMYEMSGRLVQGLTGPFLIDQGISLNAVGIFNGIGGVVSGLCGTIAGGMMVSRAGAKNAMYMIAICHAVLLAVIFSSIKLHFLSTPILFSLFVCEATLMASSFVASYSRLMILTSPYQPGIDFTLF